MHARVAPMVAAVALGITLTGAVPATAGDGNTTFHGRWSGVTDVCLGAPLTDRPTRAWGTWSLRVGRDGSATFVDDFRTADGAAPTATVAMRVLTRRPLTLTGRFGEATTLTATVHADDVVVVASTPWRCDDGTDPELVPTFVGVFTGTVH